MCLASANAFGLSAAVDVDAIIQLDPRALPELRRTYSEEQLTGRAAEFEKAAAQYGCGAR